MRARGLAAVIALALGGCEGGTTTLGPAATGTIQLDTSAARDVGAEVATQRALLLSEPVLARVPERLGDPALSVETLRELLDVERSGESSVLIVRVAGPDPERATALCNATMASYLDARADEAMRRGAPRDAEGGVDRGARVMERCQVRP